LTHWKRKSLQLKIDREVDITGDDGRAPVNGGHTESASSADWSSAAQAKMHAASQAYAAEQFELFRTYSQDAITIAERHGLRWLEILLRVSRFTYELVADSTAWNRDYLRQNLEFKLPDRLEGRIAEGLETLRRELAGALANADQELARALAAIQQGSPENQLRAWEAPIDILSRYAEAMSLNLAAWRLSTACDELHTGSVTAASCEQLQRLVSELGRELDVKLRSMRADLFLLIAQWKMKAGDLDTARDALIEAEKASQDIPGSTLKVLAKLAEVLEEAGDARGAFDAAGRGLQIAKRLPPLQARNVSADLAELRTRLGVKLHESAPAESEAVSRLGRSDEVYGLVARAHQQFLDQQFDLALETLEPALKLAKEPWLRRSVVRERALVLWECRRYREAHDDLDEALRLLTETAASDRRGGSGDLRGRIREEEELYLLTAVLEATVGQPERAWQVAEQGRTNLLKREIAVSNGTAATLSDGSFEKIRPWLSRERIAILSFAATRWGTLALSAGPGDRRPQSCLLPFSFGDVSKALGSGLPEGSALWTDVIFKSLEALSAGLLHPLHERICELARGARAIYIVPDSLLFYAPFAALSLRDGRPLVELCPMAMAASIDLLQWSTSRRRASPERSLLAVGVGADASFRFRDQAERIAALEWTKRTILLDAEATPRRLAAEAPLHRVLFIASHGILNPDVQETMAASQLALADGVVSASDVAHWKLSADLVFLNACQSARWRAEGRTQVSGFLRAFPSAGAATVIAPLTHVSPQAASDLAEAFFCGWLDGLSKAEALQAAQIQLKRNYPPPDWASHCLFGDYL
jgi:tetratricopeptide (TPR) repeat protein